MLTRMKNRSFIGSGKLSFISLNLEQIFWLDIWDGKMYRGYLDIGRYTNILILFRINNSIFYWPSLVCNAKVDYLHHYHILNAGNRTKMFSNIFTLIYKNVETVQHYLKTDQQYYLQRIEIFKQVLKSISKKKTGFYE